MHESLGATQGRLAQMDVFIVLQVMGGARTRKCRYMLETLGKVARINQL